MVTFKLNDLVRNEFGTLGHVIEEADSKGRVLVDLIGGDIPTEFESDELVLVKES